MDNVCEIWTEELKEGMLVETPDGWSEVVYLDWDHYETYLSYRTENEHRVDYHPSAMIVVSVPDTMLDAMPPDQQLLIFTRVFLRNPNVKTASTLITQVAEILITDGEGEDNE